MTSSTCTTRARAALVGALALLVPAGAAAAPDCDGGTIALLRVKGDRLVFRGTVTGPGMTRDALVDGGGELAIEIVDAAAAGAVVYRAAVPVERLVTRRKTTKYDRRGELDGSLVLKDVRAQRDTVEIALTAAGGTLGEGGELRAVVTAAGRCARTCVAPCAPGRRGRIRCRPSVRYAPAAGEGFGAFRRTPRGRTSAFCGLSVDAPSGCDPLIEESCLLPYPSSYFLARDASTPTGLRVAFGPETLPANAQGVHVDPTDWNTLDGFSPGPMLLALFPDTGSPVDLTASGVAFHTDFGRSLEVDHPTVLMEASSGARVVHFAEMDANTEDVARKALIIRPGQRLKDATRYLVAIRRLVDAAGTPVRPRLVFRALRDGGTQTDLAAACGSTCAAVVALRRAASGDLFERLEANGVEPAELVLAWDFTTASTEALTGWILAVRDQAFALGTPEFEVTSVDDGGGSGRNADIWARIEGTFRAPLFMTADAPGSRLNLVDGVPRQNGWATVPFVVDVPRSAVNPGGEPVPARPTLWGHGLLGTRFQLGGLSSFANAFNAVIGAVDMQGMSDADQITIGLQVVPDLSNFHFIPERLHQGFLNHLLLGRLMVDGTNGFNSHPAFQFGSGPTRVIDTTEVFYSGGSQGGIFGIAIMSIAEDFKRGFLSVPGANYSTLLHRALPFAPFRTILRVAYPDRLDEQVLIALVQQLWDRAEPQGYMNHLAAGDLSDPPVPHTVLIHMATHDSQVSNLGTEIMVRSLGIPQLAPVHRTFFGILEVDATQGSAFVEIDTGGGVSRCHEPGASTAGAVCATAADCPGPGDPETRTECVSGVPPLANLPPAFENGAHGSASRSEAMARQIDAFLRPNGTVQQFCSGACDPN